MNFLLTKKKTTTTTIFSMDISNENDVKKHITHDFLCLRAFERVCIEKILLNDNSRCTVIQLTIFS